MARILPVLVLALALFAFANAAFVPRPTDKIVPVKSTANTACGATPTSQAAVDFICIGAKRYQADGSSPTIRAYVFATAADCTDSVVGSYYLSTETYVADSCLSDALVLADSYKLAVAATVPTPSALFKVYKKTCADAGECAGACGSPTLGTAASFLCITNGAVTTRYQTDGGSPTAKTYLFTNDADCQAGKGYYSSGTWTSDAAASCNGADRQVQIKVVPTPVASVRRNYYTTAGGPCSTADTNTADDYSTYVCDDAFNRYQADTTTTVNVYAFASLENCASGEGYTGSATVHNVADCLSSTAGYEYNLNPAVNAPTPTSVIRHHVSTSQADCELAAPTAISSVVYNSKQVCVGADGYWGDAALVKSWTFPSAAACTAWTDYSGTPPPATVSQATCFGATTTWNRVMIAATTATTTARLNVATFTEGTCTTPDGANPAHFLDYYCDATFKRYQAIGGTPAVQVYSGYFDLAHCKDGRGFLTEAAYSAATCVDLKKFTTSAYPTLPTFSARLYRGSYTSACVNTNTPTADSIVEFYCDGTTRYQADANPALVHKYEFATAAACQDATSASTYISTTLQDAGTKFTTVPEQAIHTCTGLQLFEYTVAPITAQVADTKHTANATCAASAVNQTVTITDGVCYTQGSSGNTGRWYQSDSLDSTGTTTLREYTFAACPIGSTLPQGVRTIDVATLCLVVAADSHKFAISPFPTLPVPSAKISVQTYTASCAATSGSPVVSDFVCVGAIRYQADGEVATIRGYTFSSDAACLASGVGNQTIAGATLYVANTCLGSTKRITLVQPTLGTITKSLVVSTFPTKTDCTLTNTSALYDAYCVGAKRYQAEAAGIFVYTYANASECTQSLTGAAVILSYGVYTADTCIAGSVDGYKFSSTTFPVLGQFDAQMWTQIHQGTGQAICNATGSNVTTTNVYFVCSALGKRYQVEGGQIKVYTFENYTVCSTAVAGAVTLSTPTTAIAGITCVMLSPSASSLILAVAPYATLPNRTDSSYVRVVTYTGSACDGTNSTVEAEYFCAPDGIGADGLRLQVDGDGTVKLYVFQNYAECNASEVDAPTLAAAVPLPDGECLPFGGASIRVYALSTLVTPSAPEEIVPSADDVVPSDAGATPSSEPSPQPGASPQPGTPSPLGPDSASSTQIASAALLLLAFIAAF